MIRPALQILSPAGRGARLSVLIFHRVLPEPDRLFPEGLDAGRFDRICGWMRDWFNVLPLDRAVARLRDGTLPARSMAITFDDGYADNLHVATPILQRHGLCATFFVATGFLDGGRMFNDTVVEAIRLTTRGELDLGRLALPSAQVLPLGTPAERRTAIDRVIAAVKYLPLAERSAACARLADVLAVRLPDDLMMTSEEVRTLRRSDMQIGAHTASHPILSRLAPAEARREVAMGRAYLETLLDERVGLFAYPNGCPGKDYDETTVRLVREEGFDAAVTTAPGVSTLETDPFQLPRFTPWDAQRLRFGVRLAHNLATRVTAPA